MGLWLRTSGRKPYLREAELMVPHIRFLYNISFYSQNKNMASYISSLIFLFIPLFDQQGVIHQQRYTLLLFYKNTHTRLLLLFIHFRPVPYKPVSETISEIPQPEKRHKVFFLFFHCLSCFFPIFYPLCYLSAIFASLVSPHGVFSMVSFPMIPARTTSIGSSNSEIRMPFM